MTVDVRLITDEDRDDLASFFDSRADTTLFLRSNLEMAGLRNATHPFGGCWAGAFSGDALVAVAAHFNGGNVVVAGVQAIGDVSRFAVAQSGRVVRGVVGPWREANVALDALALTEAPSLSSRELLYRLSIDRLAVPTALEAGRVRCRSSDESELPALADWRVAFEVESLDKAPSARQRALAHESITRAHDAQRLYVLEDDSRSAVATSAFNAWADGIVQIGGVFTPPELRGRGYGRSVVAGSLLDAARRGAHRAVLFTGETNRAAQRAYEALGFEAVGDYGLLLF